jgi:hypothetical protein
MSKEIQIFLTVFAFLAFLALLIFGALKLLTLRDNTLQEYFGPNHPSGQASTAKRLSDSRYQVVFTTKTGSTSGSYNVVYNPQTNSDPTMTTFATRQEARDFGYLAYTSSPINKNFGPLLQNISATYDEVYDL